MIIAKASSCTAVGVGFVEKAISVSAALDCPGTRNGATVADESLGAFLTRHAGEEASHRIKRA
jgi:hypothetical protein